jgi:hypothetical protein
MAVVLKSSKTGKSFKIIDYNKETGIVTLQGEAATFTEKFDQDAFKSWGYELTKVEDDVGAE